MSAYPKHPLHMGAKGIFFNAGIGAEGTYGLHVANIWEPVNDAGRGVRIDGVQCLDGSVLLGAGTHYVGTSATGPRFVFDTTPHPDTITVTDGTLVMGLATCTDLTMSGDLTVEAITANDDVELLRGWLSVGVNDDTQGLIRIRGGGTGSDNGGRLLWETAADHDGTIYFYDAQAHQDDWLLKQGSTTKLTLQGSDGTFLFGAAVGMGTNDITGLGALKWSATEYLSQDAAGYVDVHWADDDKGFRFYSGANLMLTISRTSGAATADVRLDAAGNFDFYRGGTAFVSLWPSPARVVFRQDVVLLGSSAKLADNELIGFGTGTSQYSPATYDASILYNGTHLIIDPDVVGSGKVFIGATADDAISAAAYEDTNQVQVVGTQGAAVADATGAGDVVAQLNALLARCRAHGLIAT